MLYTDTYHEGRFLTHVHTPETQPMPVAVRSSVFCASSPNERTCGYRERSSSGVGVYWALCPSNPCNAGDAGYNVGVGLEA